MSELLLRRLRPVTMRAEGTITRPANTTTYAAGDVVTGDTPAVITFANCARSNGLGGIIQGALMIDSAAQSLRPDLELYLFDAAPAMPSDNAAWALTDAEAKACVGRIRFPPGLFNAGGANGIVDVDSLGKPYKCGNTTKDLFGVAVMRNAYIPVSNEEFFFRLYLIQD